MTSESISQPIRFPGELIASGQITDNPNVTEAEEAEFKVGLEEIEQAERLATAEGKGLILGESTVGAESDPYNLSTLGIAILRQLKIAQREVEKRRSMFTERNLR